MIKTPLMLLSIALSSTPVLADYQAGRDAFDSGDYKTALLEWEPLAQKGNEKAQYMVGWMHTNAKGVPQDDKLAVNWYSLAAEQGYGPAQTNLGYMFATGRGVKENNIQAYIWWDVAASQQAEKAAQNVYVAKAKLTPEEVSQAQRLARDCVANNYKGCIPTEALYFDAFVGADTAAQATESAESAEPGDKSELNQPARRTAADELEDQLNRSALLSDGQVASNIYELLSNDLQPSYENDAILLIDWSGLDFEAIRVKHAKIDIRSASVRNLETRKKSKGTRFLLDPGDYEVTIKVRLVQTRKGRPKQSWNFKPSTTMHLALGFVYSVRPQIRFWLDGLAGAVLSSTQDDFGKDLWEEHKKLRKEILVSTDSLEFGGVGVDLKSERHGPIEGSFDRSYAEFKKGQDAYKRGEYKTALKEWEPLANTGNARAQYGLGWLYQKGEGVSQDDQAAFNWHLLAAEQGHPDAQHGLGFIFANGKGVETNDIQAHMWWDLAASNKANKAAANVYEIRENMALADVITAQELARECEAKNYKGCNLEISAVHDGN